MVNGASLYAGLKAQLAAAGVEDAAFDAAVLLEQVAGRQWRWQEQALTSEQLAQLQQFAARRASREPLQYIIGRWSFLDFELEIGEGVLIPRADTELLCETAAGLLQGASAPAVLDLCAGSGCVGLGIKRLVADARLTCLEKSPAALVYLRRNLQNALAGCNKQTPAGKAIEGDVFGFEQHLAPASVALIAANPPYVTGQEMQALAPELRFEPDMALYAPNKGLAFYQHIAPAYMQALCPGGWLALEIGSAQGAAVMQILQNAGYCEIACKRDYAGQDRVIIGRRPAKLEEK